MVQDPKPEELKDPAVQTLQELEPLFGAYVPGEHLLHEAAALELYVPTEHTVQEPLPAPLYVPALHALHPPQAVLL